MGGCSLKASRSGSEAWERAESCQGAIRSVVGSMVEDQAEWDDLVSQAVKRLAQELEAHDPEVDDETCGRRIARDLCLRCLHHAAHQPPTVSLSDAEEEVPDAHRQRGWADIELGLRLEAALRSLSKKARAAVELHLLDGLTIDETAAALGMKPEAVRKSIQRAKEALREKFGEDVG